MIQVKRNDQSTFFNFVRALLIVVIVAAVSSVIVMGLSKQAQAAGGSVDTMHRLYNPNSGEHFYTSSTVERDHLTSLGWQGEGEGWKAPTVGDAVYRLYNSFAGEHHYTLSAAERDMLVGAGWDDEGIGWYSDPSKGVPLYRVYNPNEFANNHHYTTSTVERDYLLGLGWQDEGISWYGVNPDAASNPSSPTPTPTPDNPTPTPTPDNPTPSPGTPSCTVTFDANGGRIDGNSTLAVNKGNTIGTFPSAARSGYELVGWFSGRNGGFQYTTSTPINGNVTLYALWRASETDPPKSNYRVVFYANGGSGSMPAQNYYHDTTYSLPKCTFKRSGYEFDGWATSELGPKAYAEGATVCNLAPGGGTYELYARWKKL